MTLADYDRRKFELTEILRVVANARPKPAPSGDPVQELFARLAEDRFNLVVVGRFSRGKSSLMNAILGLDRLPTGVVPLTSVVTAVGYGSREQVRLVFEDRILQSEVPLDALREYVTQEGNPGNHLRVKLAEIQLPAEILRRGFYFVDTPGLGSAISENTQTTEAFLPSADAFLLVTGFESPLSSDELRVLRVVQATRRPLFVAVNKQDTAAPADRAVAMAFIREQLEALFGDGAPAPFATSATQGLAAKQSGDETALAESGVAALETALIRFLVADKSQAFLRSMCDRIEAVLAATPQAPATLRADLRALRARLSPADFAAGTLGGLTTGHPEAAGTCAICRAVEAACWDYLTRYQYDLTVDAGVRATFTRGGGFCPLHTWRYHAITSPQGICLSCPPLAEDWAARLAELADADGDGGSVAAAIRAHAGSTEHCPVCDICEQANQNAVRDVVSHLSTDGGVDHQSALCVEHLAEVVEQTPDPAARQALLRRQAGIFERTGEDMRRYALKFDAIRRPLASHAEVDSPLRALRLLAGLANLHFIRRQE